MTLPEIIAAIEADLVDCDGRADRAGRKAMSVDLESVAKWGAIELHWLAQCDALRRTLGRVRDIEIQQTSEEP